MWNKRSVINQQLLYVCLHYSTKTITFSLLTKASPSHKHETLDYTSGILYSDLCKKACIRGSKVFKLKESCCEPGDHIRFIITTRYRYRRVNKACMPIYTHRHIACCV